MTLDGSGIISVNEILEIEIGQIGGSSGVDNGCLAFGGGLNGKIGGWRALEGEGAGGDYLTAGLDLQRLGNGCFFGQVIEVGGAEDNLFYTVEDNGAVVVIEAVRKYVERVFDGHDVGWSGKGAAIQVERAVDVDDTI